uniref:Uncharacterized protein n=1 Tax=Corethron hystrix TaxID=216773 RepID=A0A7S1FQB4_9STRA|mmetsp:Transcript_20234/g.45873  ORF Transcript_20234/g.45873 Transcript_20234/m.45873 type:complete len:123 (+) Transcript_20234:162-530(+)|eukprot:CAMPEP_0113310426 /NCGR_PEP_ID=MMETSP0010_2-20120614/8075_1 /TAXON_ID=216773 ORGANISM="Corethron hystrix, Strain 308" /NCGR_SAMPLE_ID=MMETSP0010_2 /ASSEMBLY_ACC=CAM_ASM_000155 /LENGTH=122 /DNA_ID=CAMNT_0000165877 /DNA_START=103 /DNA_END=471 /DNA_ORIENTATION=- /assembly_acc=CAM_ASM_000155
MKVLSAIIAITAAQSSTAFIVSPYHARSAITSSGAQTSLQMGLFDFFSEDAKKEREERKQREIDEQERLQREIIARRRNPEKMDEYEAKVRVRRALRMAGNDEAADTVEVYTDEDVKITGLN